VDAFSWKSKLPPVKMAETQVIEEQKNEMNGTEKRGGKGGVKGGKGGKGERPPRKPRPEIPTFDDPEAELAKHNAAGAPPQPNRDALDRKIQSIQSEIEANKARTEVITKTLDSIKEANEKKKSAGAGPLEKCREGLRELKKQIVGIIEERKQISAQIDTMREKKSSMDEAIKKKKSEVGRFTSNEAISEEIQRIEDYMSHTSINLKEEKACMLQIKELNQRRDTVKELEVMEGKRGAPGAKFSGSLGDLFEARKAVDARLDVLREQEKVSVTEMNAVREKTQSKDSNRFQELLDERKGIREKIAEKITAIRELRKQYQEDDDKWFSYDRMTKNLKWQIRQKNNKEREERQKKWEEDKVNNQAAWEAEKEHRKNFDEDGNPREKFMDFDLGQRIALCEQLTAYLQKYTVQEQKSEAAAVSSNKSGRTIEAPSDLKAFSRDDAFDNDELGLNAFMVSEVVSKRSKKKDKKKKANREKNDEMALLAAGEVVTLELSLEMLQQFASMGLAVPVNSDDCEESVTQLAAKKTYYEAKAEDGLTLKEVIKAEKEAKSGKKSKKKPEEEALAAEATGRAVAVEEVEEGEEATDNEKKPDRDFLAEKMARKAAEMPDVDEAMVAELRKKAQGAKMTDEEKKARGLLYDTSKASAVQSDSDSDDDDDCVDFEGGDPFEGL